jgi:hypothetical protein
MLGRKGVGAFDPTSTYQKSVDNLIKELSDGNALTLMVEKQIDDTTTYEQFIPSSIPNFPWGVKVDDIKIAIKNPTGTLYKELEKALNRI